MPKIANIDLIVHDSGDHVFLYHFFKHEVLSLVARETNMYGASLNMQEAENFQNINQSEFKTLFGTPSLIY